MNRGKASGIFRRTRNSVFNVADFEPPYTVNRVGLVRKAIRHAAARFPGHAGVTWVCCRMVLDDENDMVYHFEDNNTPTCLMCAQCKGCPACRDNHIDEATMRLGKWETKDHRKIYPFEMDDTHLVNSIRKLIREETHFKDDWRDWLLILEEEARRREVTA